MLRFLVCDEWTELNCKSEAAPEELEEHSMVAHKVQTHYEELMHLHLYSHKADMYIL